jgi:RimJ/RimL family protein N-acetyltransferase
MPQPLEPVTLTGRHVRLEPLSRNHVAALTDAATADRSTFGLTPVPDDQQSMQRYVDQLLAGYEEGLVLPFCQVETATGQAMGCTRYLDLQWWRGRPEPDEVEIGGTWLGAAAQRTGVNTEAKFLLLRHAFETIGVWRVAICTDARNERSRRAIERIGGTFEGVLRNHRVVADAAEPSPRQTAVYSITDDEWPTISDALLAKLDR